jgi:AraC-like DNA-binding protein
MISPQIPFAPICISTEDFPQAMRLAMWRETFGRNITQVDIDPIGSEPFQASATFLPLPREGVVFGSRSPARYQTGRHQLVQERDGFGLTVLASGAPATALHLGRELVGQPGDAIVTSGADPSVSLMHQPGRIYTFALPRVEMAAAVPNLEAAFATTIPASNAALQLLTRYVRLLLQGGYVDGPGLPWTVAAHIIDLAAMAIGASVDAAQVARDRGGAAARLATVKADIRAQLGNGGLSVAVIAVRHGVSPRHIQRLFERDGTTFSAFLLQARLARAIQMLGDPHAAGRTIAAIALESGFGDVSYFNRTFRRNYGATPSDIRGQAMRAR